MPQGPLISTPDRSANKAEDGAGRDFEGGRERSPPGAGGRGGVGGHPDSRGAHAAGGRLRRRAGCGAPRGGSGAPSGARNDPEPLGSPGAGRCGREVRRRGPGLRGVAAPRRSRRRGRRDRAALRRRDFPGPGRARCPAPGVRGAPPDGRTSRRTGGPSRQRTHRRTGRQGLRPGASGIRRHRRGRRRRPGGAGLMTPGGGTAGVRVRVARCPASRPPVDGAGAGAGQLTRRSPAPGRSWRRPGGSVRRGPPHRRCRSTAAARHRRR